MAAPRAAAQALEGKLANDSPANLADSQAVSTALQAVRDVLTELNREDWQSRAELASFTVVYDACLLYPASIRDLVLELGRTGLLRAKWTERIHNEWISAVLRQRPELVRSRLERVAELMNATVGHSCGIESSSSKLTPNLHPERRQTYAQARLREKNFNGFNGRADRI